MKTFDPSITVIELISQSQETLGVTDQQLGIGMGYSDEKAVSGAKLFKNGLMKLRVSTVAPVSDLLKIDPSMLLRTVLHEYAPETLHAVDALLTAVPLNANEQKLIDSYRYLSKGYDVAPLVIEGTSIIALVTV